MKGGKRSRRKGAQTVVQKTGVQEFCEGNKMKIEKIGKSIIRRGEKSESENNYQEEGAGSRRERKKFIKGAIARLTGGGLL